MLNTWPQNSCCPTRQTAYEYPLSYCSEQELDKSTVSNEMLNLSNHVTISVHQFSLTCHNLVSTEKFSVEFRIKIKNKLCSKLILLTSLFLSDKICRAKSKLSLFSKHEAFCQAVRYQLAPAGIKEFREPNKIEQDLVENSTNKLL